MRVYLGVEARIRCNGEQIVSLRIDTQRAYTQCRWPLLGVEGVAHRCTLQANECAVFDEVRIEIRRTIRVAIVVGSLSIIALVARLAPNVLVVIFGAAPHATIGERGLHSVENLVATREVEVDRSVEAEELEGIVPTAVDGRLSVASNLGLPVADGVDRFCFAI